LTLRHLPTPLLSTQRHVSVTIRRCSLFNHQILTLLVYPFDTFQAFTPHGTSLLFSMRALLDLG
jgi:hypothetical protein